MPPLIAPQESRSIILPPRHATVAAKTDVLVVGGGPAGLGAAVGAATAGADRAGSMMNGSCRAIMGPETRWWQGRCGRSLNA